MSTAATSAPSHHRHRLQHRSTIMESGYDDDLVPREYQQQPSGLSHFIPLSPTTDSFGHTYDKSTEEKHDFEPIPYSVTSHETHNYEFHQSEGHVLTYDQHDDHHHNHHHHSPAMVSPVVAPTAVVSDSVLQREDASTPLTSNCSSRNMADREEPSSAHPTIHPFRGSSSSVGKKKRSYNDFANNDTPLNNIISELSFQAQEDLRR